ncbi:NUDIX hydrolase [Mesorhizobium sp. BR1-1-16]|uniref:NUDIX hydrolase n=1 Tax=Mesorhizobium sp. BR1-1-16 TaxID=2876653 RepID=UPI001CC966C0|nr:NUDIX hydrolase [Mesorhizobium sp. BR1-1-16]MBZ9939202.1 NUDIX hydrolase [Mesorhizobium sp. BR1-1-16]
MTTPKRQNAGPAGAALHQVAALPFRKGEEGPQVCLVTTRETRRWTIPKGWPMKGRSDSDAARIEAIEEGGLVGKVTKRPIGSFLYWKRRPTELDLIRVEVYRLDVDEQLATWKEAGERYSMWFPLDTAADLVDEPGLKAIFESLMAEPPLPGDARLLYHGDPASIKETAMAKGQMRSNKETRKPKAEKPKAAAGAPKPFASTTAAAKDKK